MLQLTTMERSPYGNRIQDVVTSRQITKAGKVIGIESLKETIKVNDPKSFVLHILNQFVYHYDTMYVQIINM